MGEDDYKAVEASRGGQVMHGKSVYEEGQRQKEAAEQEQRELEEKQARLNDILEHARNTLGGRDCTDLFMEADQRQDGHCGYEEFAQLLSAMGLDLPEEDVELMMESFFDPDHPDQTRPMSIIVLDEALNR